MAKSTIFFTPHSATHTGKPAKKVDTAPPESQSRVSGSGHANPGRGWDGKSGGDGKSSYNGYSWLIMVVMVKVVMVNHDGNFNHQLVGG